ncbi:hypothetical protein EU546_02930 [Candidatus Thorarchaeota archaeon]|nr:MAG: hypothetical protein EU546_02930 [Candidatus Thorarchaeota archaeon]
MIYDSLDIDVLRNALDRLGGLYEMKKGILTQGIKPAFSKVGKSKDYELGLYVYYIRQTGVLIVLFERDPSSGRVVVQVSAREVGAWTWSQMRDAPKVEETAMAALDEDVQAKRHLPTDGGTFSCPSCHAVYTCSNLRLSDDGRVQCQNCGRWVDWLEAVTDKSTTPNDS